MAPLLVFIDLNTAVFGNLSLRPLFLNYQIDYRYKSIGLSAQYSDEDIVAKWNITINPSRLILLLLHLII